MAEAIAVKEITKRFPGVLANDKVSFSVATGEIRAIVGENGAGKTTLMNMLYGLYHPDDGQIFVKGEEVKIPNARAAIEMGIGMVHQHFKLVPSYTLGQNIVLGIEPKKGLLIDEDSLVKSVQEVSEKYSLAVDVNKVAADASVGEQQRAEILKALYRGADILILDEPTAVLTDMETEELFVMLRGLANNGKTILFISHKLREVLAISDNTTVMRLGKVVGSVKTAETDSCKLAEMMVGRETIEGRMRKENPEIGDVVLELKQVNVLDSRDFLAVEDVDLELHSGEILGIAGVDGNGQEELTEAIMGLRPLVSGEILVNGVNIANSTNRQIRETGVAYIPSDRNRAGVAIEAHVWENLTAGEYYLPPYSGSINLHPRSIQSNAYDLVERYQIATPGIKTQTGNLSGGNVQRLIVGRELGSEKAMVVVASQPTRGIDIAGTEAIRKTLLDYADRGAGVLLISADLDEVLALSDRIVVLYEGKHKDAGPVVDGIRVQVGHLMTGGEGECPV